jgi:predicted dehydrogenase
MAHDKIRLGIIGAGFIGKIHAQMFSQVTDVQVAGITDFSRPLAEKAAVEFGIPRIFDSAEQLVDSEDLDAVVIGVPNAFHKPLAVRALGNGKHVLLEKPMALSGTEAREIVKAADASGKTLMISHQMRWEPLSRQAHSIAHSGELGTIYNARAGMMRRKAIPGWGSWFTRKSESGGGPLIDLGVHVLDLTLWLMGNPLPTSVFGSTYAMFGPRRKGLGTWGTPQWDGYCDVEDLASALIKFDNGATLHLEVSWAVNTDSDSGHAIHVMGDEGGISLYAKKMLLTGQKFDRAFDVAIPVPDGAENARVLLSRHFAHCVRTGEKPISDGISGLVNSTILDAIYRSAETGDSVKLDWNFLDEKKSD